MEAQVLNGTSGAASQQDTAPRLALGREGGTLGPGIPMEDWLQSLGQAFPGGSRAGPGGTHLAVSRPLCSSSGQDPATPSRKPDPNWDAAAHDRNGHCHWVLSLNIAPVPVCAVARGHRGLSVRSWLPSIPSPPQRAGLGQAIVKHGHQGQWLGAGGAVVLLPAVLAVG